MNIIATIGRVLGRSPLIAAVLYLTTVVLLLFAIFTAITNTLDQWRSVESKSDQLQQLRSKQVRSAKLPGAERSEGNPLLEGSTLTVAGATLLQRVSGAIVNAGGTVQSSQVDVNTGGKSGTVGLLINCELEQAGLQKLLFDVETGMPLLIVDQLDVQMPPSGGNESRPHPLRVALSVSGHWQGQK